MDGDYPKIQKCKVVLKRILANLKDCNLLSELYDMYMYRDVF